jgi:hypothetical protein
MKKLKKEFKFNDDLLIFITDGMGELDFLIPLLNELYEEKNLKITMLFMNPLIYKNFLKSSFCIKVFKNLNIKIIGKKNFIFKDLVFNNKILQKYLVNFTNQLFYFINLLPIILKLLLTNKNILIENSGRPNGSKFLNLIFKLFIFKNFSFFIYPHGCVPVLEKYEPITSSIIKNKIFNNFNYIITHTDEINFYKSVNISGNPYYIDFPPAGKLWIKKIKLLFNKPINQNYICIFLNRITVSEWGSEIVYEYILKETLSILAEIEELKNYKIIFKRHSKYYKKNLENKILEKNLKIFKFDNFEFSDESIFLLSTFSKCNICINSNAIFASYAVNKNSFFFYPNDLFFKKYFPNGHKAEAIGLPCTSDKTKLKQKILEAIN